MEVIICLEHLTVQFPFHDLGITIYDANQFISSNVQNQKIPIKRL